MVQKEPVSQLPSQRSDTNLTELGHSAPVFLAVEKDSSIEIQCSTVWCIYVYPFARVNSNIEIYV